MNPQHSSKHLSDTQSRRVHYLRLSLTSACQMRCSYCRPRWLKQDVCTPLTADEIRQLVGYLINHHGVHKVRLTGGDPTTRKDLTQIIEQLATLRGIDDLAMTTNGMTLARHATNYAQAGLHRVNISLDTLDPDQFARITGIDGLTQVIEGIDTAIHANLTPLKINTVVMRGENEDQLAHLVDFAASRGAAIRFIELMPMGPLADVWAQRYVSQAQMHEILSRDCVDHWRPMAQHHDSARCYKATLRDGRVADIGFISPMSCHFCAACNRLRLTSDGLIYPCLMDQPQGNFLKALRPVFDDRRLDQLLAEAMNHKAEHHPAHGAAVMTTIGG